MKKRILLIDESLTVQKVVALTLDKDNYQVLYARSRQEVIKAVVDEPVDLILLSENVGGLNWPSFPKELESWLGTTEGLPAIVLISGQEIREAKHFAAVLKKPFSPPMLQELVESLLGNPENIEKTYEKDRTRMISEDPLQSVFNRKFSDEHELVRQTFEEDEPKSSSNSEVHEVIDWQEPEAVELSLNKATPKTASELWQSEPSKSNIVSKAPGTPKENTEDLWGTQNQLSSNSVEASPMRQQDNALLSSEDSMAYKSFLQNEVKSKIQERDLEEMVKKALTELMPPIVEKLVQQRLDELLKDHEESLAS